MIKAEILEHLKRGKNLLAFSYGVDSTALFYLLERKGVKFDLALINYKLRSKSDIEEKEARFLAKQFNKQIFITHAPKFEGNFESKARKFRYRFFSEICEKQGFENVILAHQLNDQFEWFLMQFSKGAGLSELLGMKELEKRANFTLVRPLLHTSRTKILNFLKQEKLHFFEDESNDNERYFRNFMRKNFSNSFLSAFENGVQRSFEYLQKDLKAFSNFEKEVREFKGVILCEKNESLVAKLAKKFGILMSAKQRKIALKGDCVIANKLGIVYRENKALLFNFETCQKMPKTFKEECRKAKIPPLLRAYLYKHQVSVKEFIDKLI